MSGCQDCKRLIAALDKARDERDEARAALDRYADPENWFEDERAMGRIRYLGDDGDKDGWLGAKAALEG